MTRKIAKSSRGSSGGRPSPPTKKQPEAAVEECPVCPPTDGCSIPAARIAGLSAHALAQAVRVEELWGSELVFSAESSECFRLKGIPISGVDFLSFRFNGDLGIDRATGSFLLDCSDGAVFSPTGGTPPRKIWSV